MHAIPGGWPALLFRHSPSGTRTEFRAPKAAPQPGRLSHDIPELAVGLVVKISKFCADAHLFIAWGERVDNESRDTLGEKMVDHNPFQRHLWREAKSDASAHINDGGEWTCAGRLEQRAGYIFGRRVIDWNRDGVGVFAPNRRRCLTGCES